MVEDWCGDGEGWYLVLLFDGVGLSLGMCCGGKGLVGMGGMGWVDGEVG